MPTHERTSHPRARRATSADGCGRSISSRSSISTPSELRRRASTLAGVDEGSAPRGVRPHGATAARRAARRAAVREAVAAHALDVQIAVRELGGDVIEPPPDVALGEREPIDDVARNLERWVSGVVIRTFAQERLARVRRPPRRGCTSSTR